MNQLLIQQQKPTGAVPASRLHRPVRGASGLERLRFSKPGVSTLYPRLGLIVSLVVAALNPVHGAGPEGQAWVIADTPDPARCRRPTDRPNAGCGVLSGRVVVDRCGLR